MPDELITPSGEAPSGDDFLVSGMDSFINPQKLPPGFYAEAMNVINRGGVVKTRPGSKSILTLPEGQLQGITLFQPSKGLSHLVFAVSGGVYVSRSPFVTYSKLENIQFHVAAKFITWATCLKSTEYNEMGVKYVLPEPYSVLIMQDGNTRAAYWDGTSHGHLNPTKSPTSITQPGLDQTVVGLWMRWSNNRLWVSRYGQIFASDIGDPLKFTETQYLNEGRAFYLPGDCTGIAETTDQQGIICFTSETGTFIRSSIQDRTLWLQTPDFQRTILPGIGCSAGRSIVQQYGLLWWYSSRGLISLNDALKSYISSRIDAKDDEMFSTKQDISYDLSVICGTSYENFLVQSVPYGDKYNRRSMVMDQAPLADGGESGFGNCWASFWTGWRPVEWAAGAVDGQERRFFASVDYDGVNRVWEAFLPVPTDNGSPITCYMASRDNLYGNRDYKEFSYGEVELAQLEGNVSLMIAIATDRGAYQRASTKEIVATNGQVYYDEEYGYQAHLIASTLPQQRLAKTQNGSDASECNSACIEVEIKGLIGKSFSVLFVWSGSAGISAYRIFTRSAPSYNTYSGRCEENEAGPRILTPEGCGEVGLFSESSPFEIFSSTKSYTSDSVTREVTATSVISQQDADRKAELSAQNWVLGQIGQIP